MVVPEATEKRIADGQEFMASVEVAEPPQVAFDEAVSNQEIYARVEAETRSKAHVSQLPAPRLQRFLGAMIDSLASGLAFVISAVLATMMFAEAPTSYMIVLFSIPLMLAVCQAQMTVTEGKTIGKYCVKTKIVDNNGNPPGVLQGIVLRCVVVLFLGMIPFFSLVNYLWIFGNDSNRCLHDYIAGTYVVND